MPLDEWLPHMYATLFVAVLARLLGRALKQNALALQQADLDQRRFDAVARVTRHALMIVDVQFKYHVRQSRHSGSHRLFRSRKFASGP